MHRSLRCQIYDVEKRTAPSKHYVYLIRITWSEGSILDITRRYSVIFEFHTKLLDLFPQEAGFVKGAERTIPYLTGKKIFERTNTRKVLNRWFPNLSDCHAKERCDPRISQRFDKTSLKDFLLRSRESLLFCDRRRHLSKGKGRHKDRATTCVSSCLIICSPQRLSHL